MRQSIRPLPVPALVPSERRTVIRRHGDDPETAQLRRENRGTATGAVSAENLDRPAHRASQPNRLSGPPVANPPVTDPFTIDPAQPISPAGPLAVRFQICETGTWASSSTQDRRTSVA